MSKNSTFYVSPSTARTIVGQNNAELVGVCEYSNFESNNERSVKPSRMFEFSELLEMDELLKKMRAT